MKLRVLLFLISATLFNLSRGNPVEIQVQENFAEEKIYGKWYDIAVGTTCRWMKQYKDRFSMGTLEVGPGETSDKLSITTTRLRQGRCSQATGEYQKTSVPGKFTSYNPKWGASVESYVVHTNYEEYAIFVMKKNSTYGLSTTAKLYGRSPILREDLVAEFRQLALGLGIPEDSIFNLMNKGAKEDHCLLQKDAGPCLGSNTRFFYNTTSKTCEIFEYGGCLGNGNNFHSERACLQTCRTEAACRLPIVPGQPCSHVFWAFDANRGKCVTFKGCGGNSNKFYLEKECREYCGVLPDGEEEFLHLPPQ